MNGKKILLIFLILLFLKFPPPVFAADNITPGQIVIEPPTLHSLGFQWPVSGDDNRNSVVNVSYRQVGSTNWMNAMPMLHRNGELTETGTKTYTVLNSYAGSVLNLQPATPYEVKFDLIDPDGGGQSQTVTATTKALFSLPNPLRTLHVYPPGTVNMIQPAYTDIITAYSNAQAGDLILIHPGTYTPSNFIKLNKPATFNLPIVIRGENVDTTIIDKALATDRRAFLFSSTYYHIIENLTIKNADTAMITTAPSNNIIVRNNKIYNSNKGVNCILENGCYNYTITNNYIQGSFSNWVPWDTLYPLGYGGIAIQGSGNDVSFNTVTRFTDAIDSNGYYNRTADTVPIQFHPVSNDIYNNYLIENADDCIETDWSEDNIRVYQNFCANSMSGYSTQPIYGGPVYFIRNIAYNNLSQPIKPNNRPSGFIYLNNTFVSLVGFNTGYDRVWSNSQLYNNIFMDVNGDGHSSLDTGTCSPTTSKLDYNGYRIGFGNSGSQLNFCYNYYNCDGALQTSNCSKTLAVIYQLTGQEQHGITMDYDSFMNFTPSSGQAIPVPALDLRLKNTSPAVDRGRVIANVTDGFSGTAPDLGAYEVGAAVPVYGYTDPNLISSPTPTPTPTVQPSPSPTPAAIPGDTNGDGKVDGIDYVTVVIHFGQTVSVEPSGGDLNLDGKVDISDLNLVISNIK